jgi:hypothetical protein
MNMTYVERHAISDFIEKRLEDISYILSSIGAAHFCQRYASQKRLHSLRSFNRFVLVQGKVHAVSWGPVPVFEPKKVSVYTAATPLATATNILLEIKVDCSQVSTCL